MPRASGIHDRVFNRWQHAPARIVAVVDAWDAMLSDRTYRKSWTRQQVIEHLKEQAGRQFDPQVAQRFLQVVT